MKKAIIILIVLISGISTFAQDSTDAKLSVGKYNFRFVGQEHFYPIYLADPLAPRLEGAYENVLYSDFHYEDEVNQGGDYMNKFYINTGTRLTLFSFSPKNKPHLGYGFEIGASMPLYMQADGFDFMAVDGIFYFAITGKPTDYLSFRLSKHHICTHRGDEYAKGTVDSPIDFDPNKITLFVRDDYYISAAYKPLSHLIHDKYDFLQLYGDIIFFSPGTDFLGERMNKPERYAYMAFQGGAELEYYFPRSIYGGVFTALNISTYEANGYSKNLSLVGGYILPQEKNKRKVRIGFRYYDGRGILNEFYHRREKFTSFFFAADI